MGTALSIEKWADVESEIEELFAAHLLELGGSTLALDLSLCRALSAADAMVLVIARDSASMLIGYCIWTIGPSLERLGETIAELKPWYVRPEWRKSSLGLRLFKESLDVLRARGIKRCFPHHWGNETLGKFFSRMGAKPVEWVYEMEL